MDKAVDMRRLCECLGEVVDRLEDQAREREAAKFRHPARTWEQLAFPAESYAEITYAENTHDVA